MTSERNIIDDIEETIEQPFNMEVRDGEFVITPAEAGIAMLAALSQRNDAETLAWETTEELAKELEKYRQENARYREALEPLVILLEELGFEERAHQIERALWPVIGVLEDGTEVAFEYYEED